MRKRSTIDYTLADIYKTYCEEVPKEIRLSKRKFVDINKAFVKKLTDKILLESEEVRLPTMGTLRVKKFKNTYKKGKLKVDFALTRKLGKTMYHLNEHREGFAYRFTWRKPKIINNSYYSFIPERYNLRRRLAKILKNNPEIDFFQ